MPAEVSYLVYFCQDRLDYVLEHTNPEILVVVALHHKALFLLKLHVHQWLVEEWGSPLRAPR